MNSSNRSQVLSDVKGELSGRSEPPTISIPNETDSRLSAMTMEVWKLEKALTCMRAEKDAELKEATEMLKSSENTVQALRLLDDSARHRQTLDEKRRRTDALQLSQSAKTIGDLQKEVARSKEKYTLLEKERQEEETQFSDEREALRAEIQRKEKEHQDLEERMVMAQDCMKDLVEKVNDSEELGREKQRTLNADRDAFESAITSQRSDFEVTIADLEALVRDATKRNDCLTRERDRQIQVSAQQQAEINRIKQEAEENTGQLREYEKRIAAYKTRIDGLIAEAEARWKNRSQPLDDIPDLFEPNNEMVASPEPSSPEASTEPEPVPSFKRKRVESSGHQQQSAYRRRFSSGQAVVPALSTNGTAGHSDADGREHSAFVRPLRRAAITAPREFYDSDIQIRDHSMPVRRRWRIPHKCDECDRRFCPKGASDYT